MDENTQRTLPRLFVISTDGGLEMTVVFKQGESDAYIQELFNDATLGGYVVTSAREATEMEDRESEVSTALARSLFGMFPDMSESEVRLVSKEAVGRLFSNLCEHEWNLANRTCAKCGLESEIGCNHDPEFVNIHGEESLVCKKCNFIQPKVAVEERAP